MNLSALIPALLDFQRAPGRWPLGRREPALLYAQIPLVLQLAAGRPVEGLQAWDTAGQAQARQAARFFVRTVLLRTGADPYTVLGLSRSADAEAIRAHYRLMIRLTHPDFSGATNEWPADAATRINLANDVLSSPVRRAELDSALDKAEAEALRLAKERLATVASATVVAPRAAAEASGKARSAPAAPGLSPALKMAGLALGAVAALAGFILINPASEDRSLVARGSTRDALAAADRAGAPEADSPAGRYRLVATDEVPAKAAEPPEADGLSLKMATGTLPQPGEPPAAPASTPAPVAEAPDRTQVAKAAPAPVRAPRPAPLPDPERVAPRVAARTATAPPTITPTPSPTPANASTSAEPVAVVMAPPPAPLVAAAPAVTVSAEPKAAAPLAAVTPPPAGLRPPKLAEVQPLLTRVEQVAQRGLGIPLAMLIHPSTRNTPVTQKFIFDFQDSLAGYRVAGLSRSEVNAREAGDQLDVDLRMQFNLEDAQGSNLSRQIGVRARFGRIDDKVALVRMTLLSPGAGR